MPLDRRFELTRSLMPSFVNSWSEIFEHNPDAQLEALVDEARSTDRAGNGGTPAGP